eukprot:366421-Chlamydomonas_euryale.AAC.4
MPHTNTVHALGRWRALLASRRAAMMASSLCMCSGHRLASQVRKRCGRPSHRVGMVLRCVRRGRCFGCGCCGGVGGAPGVDGARRLSPPFPVFTLFFLPAIMRPTPPTHSCCRPDVAAGPVEQHGNCLGGHRAPGRGERWNAAHILMAAW